MHKMALAVVYIKPRRTIARQSNQRQDRKWITGSTIAAPSKAFVDLMTESSARRAHMMDAIGLRRIFEGMLRLGAVSLEDVKKRARTNKCTRRLDDILKEEVP